MFTLWVLIPWVLFLGGAESSREAGSAVAVNKVEYFSGHAKVAGLLFLPPGPGPFPGVVVVHEDDGLTDWIKDQARHLAQKGRLVLAVDLYRGQVAGDLLEAHILDRGLPEDRVQADLQGAVDFLEAQPKVQPKGIGIIGWDSGGGYALDAAIHDPRVHAVVVCYGRLTTDPNLLGSLKAPVLGIFGGKDEGISLQTIEQFRKALGKAGKRNAGLHVYPACAHGFMNPSSAIPSEPSRAAEVGDAWLKIDTFLTAELKSR